MIEREIKDDVTGIPSVLNPIYKMMIVLLLLKHNTSKKGVTIGRIQVYLWGMSGSRNRRVLSEYRKNGMLGELPITPDSQLSILLADAEQRGWIEQMEDGKSKMRYLLTLQGQALLYNLRDLARHFEFAYISLYQAVELINYEYLDLDENGTWFIKYSGEDAKSWTTNIHKECIETKTSGEASSKYPEWQKMASLYYQLWGQTNKAFGYQLQTFINERNKFMHNESNKNSPIHSETGYLDLLEVIVTICSFI